MNVTNESGPIMTDGALFVLGRHIQESLWKIVIERYPDGAKLFSALPEPLQAVFFKPRQDFPYSIGGIWGAVLIERYMNSLLRFGEHGALFVPGEQSFQVVSCSFIFRDGKKDDPARLKQFVNFLHEQADFQPDTNWQMIMQRCRSEVNVDVFCKIAPLLDTPKTLSIQEAASDEVLSPLAGLVPIQGARITLPLHDCSADAPIARIQCAKVNLPYAAPRQSALH